MSHFNYIPGVYNPPIAHYNELRVPDYVEVGLLIGKGGKHFKYITYKTKCTYIWYNKDRRVIELWGPEWALIEAKNMFTERFEQFKPDVSFDELETLVNISTYTRENGESIFEIEGPEWAVRGYCARKFEVMCVEDEQIIDDNTFWMKFSVH
jgi:hypothetical protein